MRIRGALTTVAIALLLAACGDQTHPGNQQPNSETLRPAALRTKVDAQIQDPCFERPGELAPQDCRKYVTQISNTANSLRRIEQEKPALRDTAQTIDKGIKDYRGNGCASATKPQQKCTKALSTAADGLQAAHDTLNTGKN